MASNLSFGSGTTVIFLSTGSPDRSRRTSLSTRRPEDGGAHPDRKACPARRLPLPSGQSFHPRHQQSVGEARLTRHQRGFKQFSRPVFPSPGAPGQNGSPLGFPPSFAPRRPGADDARRGGDRPSSTDLELHAQHHISRSSNRAFSHYVRPRVAPPGAELSGLCVWMIKRKRFEIARPSVWLAPCPLAPTRSEVALGRQRGRELSRSSGRRKRSSARRLPTTAPVGVRRSRPAQRERFILLAPFPPMSDFTTQPSPAHRRRSGDPILAGRSGVPAPDRQEHPASYGAHPRINDGWPSV